IDFERFDEQVVALGDLLESTIGPRRVVLDPAAAAIVEDAAPLARIQFGSTADLTSVFGQLLSLRLSSMYAPLGLWWTEGSAAVEPSCLIGRGLPPSDTLAALLDGAWEQ